MNGIPRLASSVAARLATHPSRSYPRRVRPGLIKSSHHLSSRCDRPNYGSTCRRTATYQGFHLESGHSAFGQLRPLRLTRRNVRVGSERDERVRSPRSALRASVGARHAVPDLEPLLVEAKPARGSNPLLII